MYIPFPSLLLLLTCVWNDRELRALFTPNLSRFAWHITLSVLKIQIIWLQLLQQTHNSFTPQGLIQQIYSAICAICSQQSNFENSWYQSPRDSINPASYNSKLPWPTSLLLQLSLGKKGNLWYLLYLKPIQIPAADVSSAKIKNDNSESVYVQESRGFQVQKYCITKFSADN